MPGTHCGHAAANRASARRIAAQAVLAALLALVLGSCTVPNFGIRDDAPASDAGSDADAAPAVDHCLNQAQDEGETAVDCGGSCPACAPGLGCVQNTDCDSSVCDNGACSQPTCSDAVLNGDETERDCGGSRCPKCAPGQGCKVDTDCASNTCQARVCALTCLDGKGDCDGDLANGCEANLQTDPLHCGDCGTPCSLAHATSACSGGKCLVDKCTAPFADCDGDPSNGCETNTSADPASCGGCGQACVALNGTPSCAAGACQITCNTGFADCDDSRANGCEIDLTTDSTHCASCDQKCDATSGTAFCHDSMCGIRDCPAGTGDCNGSLSDGCERNLTNDANNCGSCGKTCLVPGGTGACVDSLCKVASCSTGRADCNAGTAAGLADGCEVNTDTDPNNCGKCGAVCAITNGTAKCVAGKCQVKTCTPPFADCAGTGLACATDTSANGSNCGGCGASCNAVFSPLHGTGKCVTSSCQLDQCSSGFADCNKQEVDGCEANEASDSNNCGTCGSACKAPHGTNSCSASKCVPVCGTAFGVCDGIVNNGCATVFATDKKNCGSCNAPCLDNFTSSNNCSAGVCAPMCLASYQSCDKNPSNGCESNQLSDTANCGGCGTVCLNGHGTTTCSGGGCAPTCSAGFNDCDGNPNNGCELPTSSDSANCGGCKLACKTTNASATSCLSSACKPVCNDGWAACQNPQNGCTTSLDSASNCGSCGKVCGPTSPFCINRLCQQRLDIKVVNSGTTGASTSSNATMTMSHALASAAGSYRVVVVGVVNYGTAALAVKYNNVSMTLAKSAVTNQVWGGVFYLADSALPATVGTYTISVTGGTFGILGEAMELTGVDQTTPLDSTTSSVRNDGTCVSQTDTLSVLSDAALMYGVVAVYASAGDAGTAAGSQTQVLDMRSTAMGALAGYLTPVNAGSHSFAWSVNAGCVSTGGVLVALRAAVTP